MNFFTNIIENFFGIIATPLKKMFGKTKWYEQVEAIFSNPAIKSKIFFTVGMLILYRFMASIPPAGINVDAFVSVFKDNPLTSIFTLATGGSLENPSLVMIGLGAYINASIIVQLLGTVIPKLEELQKEGARGRMILSQYTRYLTIPLSAMQAVVIWVILSRSSIFVSTQFNFDVFTFIVTLTAGSLILMWISELLTEHGIGNGSSLIISFSILSSLPSLIETDIGGIKPIFNTFLQGNIGFIDFLTAPQFLYFLVFLVGFFLIVVMIVFVNEGIRKIPIQYARRTVSITGNFLPLRMTQAGVMPIIFASAILTFPGIIAQVVGSLVSEESRLMGLVNGINNSFLSNYNSFGYTATYFFLIIAFTFFYTFVISKPSDTAENLKKSGGFIPGIRPGKSTENYLIQVMIRLTSVGAVFLAFIAVLPTIARVLMGGSSTNIGIMSGIGGTSILIMVSVFLSTYRQINAMKVTRSYTQYK